MENSTHIFTDKFGRAWKVELNGLTAMEVDKEDFSDHYSKPFSILSPQEEDIRELLTNTGLILHVVWVLVRKQAEDRNVAFESFLEGLGDMQTIEAAKEVFWEVYSTFFPQMRTTFLKLKEAGEKLKTAAQKVQPRLLERLDQEIEQAIGKLKENSQV